MRVTGWLIGCSRCGHAALARMPLDDVHREAHKHGWARRQRGQRRVWVCPACAGVRLPTQPRTSAGLERRES